jgi:hypothetical protein
MAAILAALVSAECVGCVGGQANSVPLWVVDR